MNHVRTTQERRVLLDGIFPLQCGIFERSYAAQWDWRAKSERLPHNRYRDQSQSDTHMSNAEPYHTYDIRELADIVDGHMTATDYRVHFLAQLVHGLGVFEEVIHDERQHACYPVSLS